MFEGISKNFLQINGFYNVKKSEIFQDQKQNALKCQVQFLDNSIQFFEVQKHAKGDQLLNLVFNYLEIIEKEYFGLVFKENNSCFDLTYIDESQKWLDGSKVIKKQFQKSSMPYILYFKVKFYVPDPTHLHEEYTRYQYFLQLCKDISDENFLMSSESACILASYILQAELGDHDSKLNQDYFSKILHLSMPASIQNFLERTEELYKNHRSLTRTDAEYCFLKHAKDLEMYGIHLSHARDSVNNDVYIGVYHNGLVIFKNGVRWNHFPWSSIINFSFRNKEFSIKLHTGNDGDNLHTFDLLSSRYCKNFWKCCVENHTFFRLRHPNIPLRISSFFRYHYRYTGRTHYQTSKYSRHGPLKIFIRKNLTFNHIQNACNAYDEPLSAVPSKVPCILSPFKNDLKYENKNQWENENFQENSIYPSCESMRNSDKDQEIFFDALDANGTTKISPFVPHFLTKNLSFIDDDSETELRETRNIYDTKSHTICTEIHLHPNDNGCYGFNLKGGIDQNTPITVTRVAPGTPADLSSPRLREGDQVYEINGESVDRMTHNEAVNLIRESSSRGGLLLKVKSSDEPSVQYVLDVATPSRSLNLSMLQQSMLLLAEISSTDCLTSHFERLDRRRVSMTVEAALRPENRIKNRYNDILPYDATRVILKDFPEGDYINANYVNIEIPGTNITNRYIACQGPLKNTCSAFWHMIWQNDSSIIVMLTTTVERGHTKCYKYWPDFYETLQDGNLQISLVGEKCCGPILFRDLKLCHVNSPACERIVTHFQYTSWPDHGVPEDCSQFLELVVLVREQKRFNPSVVTVHCSAGIGRTGVFILMETALSLIDAGQPIYPLQLVKNMRDQRPAMIQNSSQYRFVCEAIQRVYHSSKQCL